MEYTFIEMQEDAPKLKSKKCKFIALVIELLLTYSIYLATIISWFLYDYFIAFFTLILSFIIVGIIRSKVRNIAIPFKQREFQYSDKDISKFYTYNEICYNHENIL